MDATGAITVHGFNVADRGRRTTGALHAPLADAGISASAFATEERGLLDVRTRSAKNARKLAARVRPGHLLIGHSDGCHLIDRACWYLSAIGAPRRVLCVYLNPALDVDTPLAPNVAGCLVMHTRSDWVVLLSSWLVGHRWGRMGRSGYRPVRGSAAAKRWSSAARERERDHRYHNCEYDALGIDSPGHSGVFRTARARRLVVGHMAQWAASVPEDWPA
jgi:hypothetical protein